ncbi:MAG: S53 family peptidase [Syntrophobacteraceae bacterium]|jgi:subtilase family serine protease
MKNYFSSAIAFMAVTLLLVLCNFAFAQQSNRGSVAIPLSNTQRAEDAGVYAHTNLRIFIPETPFSSPHPAVGKPPYSGYFYETPASIACVYQLVTPVSGCNPNTVTVNPSGGSKAIAVVDAYHAPNALNDLTTFSKQFGLTLPTSKTFQVVFASGSKPAYDAGWELEESLDIEWAHAMAPNATLYLVEAHSSSYGDLFYAVQVASKLVAAAGGGEVTMSWGGGEFSGEIAYDTYLQTSGVVYFASSGDGVIPGYPAVSPYVVAVGGTSVRRNPTTGSFMSEGAWEYAGSGPSLYEHIPAYQNNIASIVGKYRGVPDISAVADPYTGVWVYDSNAGGWWIVGGTSVASPVMAGIVNNAGHFNKSTAAELTEIYSDAHVTTDFAGVTQGFCGPYMGYAAAAGWNFCTGFGSPRGTANK